MSKQIAVIGLGRFGSAMARTLYSLGNEVLAIDKDMRLVEDIAGEVTQSIQADLANEDALHALGLHNFDTVVICSTQNLQESILITMMLEEHGVKDILCSAQSELHARILAKVGADTVVLPDRDMGQRIAHRISSPNVLDFVEFTPGYSLVGITPHKDWIDKELVTLNLRQRYGINVVAIQMRDGGTNISPDAHTTIRKGDTVIVLGSDEGIGNIESSIGG